MLLLVEVNYALAEAIADLGLADQPKRRPFDESMTVLTLYDTAAQIYAQLPEELFAPSFNTVEYWERVAREVLFDSNDYFQKKYSQEA